MTQRKIAAHSVHLIQRFPRIVFIFNFQLITFFTIVHLRRDLFTKIMTSFTHKKICMKWKNKKKINKENWFRSESLNRVTLTQFPVARFFFLRGLWNFAPRWVEKRRTESKHTWTPTEPYVIASKIIYNPKITNTFQCRERRSRHLR